MPETASATQLLRDLRALKKLFAKPKSWVRGVYAADKNGKVVDPTAPSACRWCLTGGTYYVVRNGAGANRVRIRRLHNALVDAIGATTLAPLKSASIPYFNDQRARNIDRIRRVIARAIADRTPAKKKAA